MFFSQKKLIKGIGVVCLLMTSVAFAGKTPSPKNIDGATTIKAEQAKKLWKEGVTFIDTRKGSDWEAGRVPGAVHINVEKPEFTKEKVLEYVGLNEPVVSYCNAKLCHRSAMAAKKLVEFGFTKVYYYRDGFPSWKNAGYPYE